MTVFSARNGSRGCTRPGKPTALALVLVSLLVSAARPADPAEGEFLSGDLEAAFESRDDSAALQPDAADFEKWEPLFDEEQPTGNLVPWYDPSLKVIDRLRHLGFHHSSTDGRHTDKGVPLQGTSWLNRPYHADWFFGSLLGGDLMSNHVEQGNDLFAGVRIGYDFDYYWGLDWRFGWAKPTIDFASANDQPGNGSYFITDIDLKYYPWGDSKVRPYYLIGTGLARLQFVDDVEIDRSVTLVTMPLGMGLEFHQLPWWVWRLEVLDNLAFGADEVETLNNFSFTVGMEWRLGARPRSYWPWRSSRNVW